MGNIAEEMCDVTFFLFVGEIQAQDMALPRSVGEKNQSFLGISRTQKASFRIDLGLQEELTCVDFLIKDESTSIFSYSEGSLKVSCSSAGPVLLPHISVELAS